MQLRCHISSHRFSVACGPPKALMLTNIYTCTTDGPESRKTGHAALKQQLKLCTVHSNNPFIPSSACNTSDPPLGGVSVSPHLLLLLGDACILSSCISPTLGKDRPGIHTEEPDWTPHFYTAHVYRRVDLSLFLPKGGGDSE